MPIDTAQLPSTTGIARVEHDGRPLTALWSGARLMALDGSLNELLHLSVAELASALDSAVTELNPGECTLLAPAESQEVWACGVTYLRSRSARMEESSVADIYARVYAAERPELFFKAAGWRVVGHGGDVGVRPDSNWNVPEPELAVLSNSRGEVVAFACANDMSSRSIEGENPLYLPQAKIYDRSCSIGPVAVLASAVNPTRAQMRMTIMRQGKEAFSGLANVSEMVRDPAQLTAVLHSVYPLPDGAWLLTGTSLVPPQPYTAEPGDLIVIEIERVGRLLNRVVGVPHSGATALPRGIT